MKAGQFIFSSLLALSLVSSAYATIPTGYSLTDSGMAGAGSRAVGDYFGTTQYMDPAAGGLHVVDIHAINDSGVVVGEFVDGNDVVHGFRGVEDLGEMPHVSNGAWINYVSNINSSGTVVGQYSTLAGPSSWQAFRTDTAWGTSTPTLLYDGFTDNARPSDINDDGYVVGQLFINGSYSPVLWPNDATAATTATFITIPTGAFHNSRAGAINSVRNIAGNSNGGALGSKYNSTVWVTGPGSVAATAIPAPSVLDDGGFIYHVMADMNESGAVIGDAGRPWTLVAPFVWIPDTPNGTTGTSTLMTSVVDATTAHLVDPVAAANLLPGQELDVKLGRSSAINDAGLAVGWLNDDDTAGSNSNVETNASFGHIKDDWMKESTQAFLWDTNGGNTQAVFLESLLPSAEQSLYRLLIATDINNSNQVTVLYKLEAEITAEGFADAPIYAGVLNVSPRLAGDADYDGDVDLTDLAILAGNWGLTNPPTSPLGPYQGNFDGDGDVDLTDLAILAGNWGVGTVLSPVPEPTSAVLIGLAAPAVRRKRR